jgi:hypothetical protein
MCLEKFLSRNMSSVLTKTKGPERGTKFFHPSPPSAPILTYGKGKGKVVPALN